MKIDRIFQENYRNNQFYNDKILVGISKNVKLHDEYLNPLSSATSCLNVMGYLNQNKSKIIPFFDKLGLKIDEVVDFPSNVDVEGEIYDDTGPILFEWIGPKKSPINERGGSRGQNRTSIDAFFIAKVAGKYSQIFLEWKFTESYNSGKFLHNFGGKKGIERLRRYSSILSKQRNEFFPFNFMDEDSFGLFDFSYEPFYQLLRMTILAKETTPIKIGSINIENYFVCHLIHSENKELMILKQNHLQYSPGIQKYTGMDLHELWKLLLTEDEKKHFHYGFWNEAIKVLNDETKYLENRYM